MAKFYTKYIVESGASGLQDGQVIYISGGHDVYATTVTNEGSSDVSSLKSNQEEVDTRIVLHAVAATNSGANHIVVCSPHIDVLVFASSLFSHPCHIFIFSHK